MNYKYTLPFVSKEIIEIEAPYHLFAGNMQYCVDFFLPECVPIIASRPGIIIECEDKYRRTCFRPVSFTNCVVIKHHDGEKSLYAHLKNKSLKVCVGQKVKRGQVVGLSGQTGLAWYPHLHFGVYSKTGKNVKISFKQKINKRLTVQEALEEGAKVSKHTYNFLKKHRFQIKEKLQEFL